MTGTARPVRVCFLIDELASAGTETQLLALIRELDRQRVKPYLCLLRGDNPVSRALEPAECSIVRLNVGSLRSPATVLRGWKLTRFLRQERIDVLQVYFPDSTYVGVPAAWLAGVPAIVRTRNNVGHWLTPMHRWLGRLMNAFTTVTVANCDAARSALIEAEKPRPERVVVLENGVDLSRFDGIADLDKSRPLRRVGAVANLRTVKGLDVLIDAAARVCASRPDVSFRIAGEGPERGALQQRIADNGLDSNFELCGSIADVPRFLGDIDVAVLPSRAEGMSNAVLEYMAAGRAIVVTDVGANARLVRNGVIGLLVPPDDAVALTDAIGRLLDQPELACRLAASARMRAREEFSRAAMVRRFEEFYLDLASRSRLRRSA